MGKIITLLANIDTKGTFQQKNTEHKKSEKMSIRDKRFLKETKLPALKIGNI